MPASITTDQVWREIQKGFFAVLGMVTAKGEARTVSVVSVVRERQLYIGTYKNAWKTKHIARNPNVSLTVTIPKRTPFMPWVPVPAATITFQGEATIHAFSDVGAGIIRELRRGMKVDEAYAAEACVIRVKPKGRFVTYGVGVSLLTMRSPAAGRVPV